MDIQITSPTIADVARRAGVSIATVSRVLNGNVPVQPETAERVRTAIRELNYFPRTAARTLASRRTDTLGLLLPEIAGYFFSPLLRGIEAAAREAGFDLLIHTTQPEHASGRGLRRLGEQNTDGLIVFAGSLDLQELTRLRAIRFPVILLHQAAPDGLAIACVTVENKKGTRQLIEHLITVHGRRRIVFLRGPEDHEDTVWRERGYREALQAYNIPTDANLITYGGFDEATAYAATQCLVKTGVDFDAVFSGNDDAASGVLLALQDLGRRIPEDVSVVGFDNVPFSRHFHPPLTTVSAPTEQVGRAAVTQLIRLIQGTGLPENILLPTHLMLRRSCGCSPDQVIERNQANE